MELEWTPATYHRQTKNTVCSFSAKKLGFCQSLKPAV
jgi:hypothetical protein